MYVCVEKLKAFDKMSAFGCMCWLREKSDIAGCQAYVSLWFFPHELVGEVMLQLGFPFLYFVPDLVL